MLSVIVVETSQISLTGLRSFVSAATCKQSTNLETFI